MPPSPPLASAAVPAASVPIRFPSTKSPVLATLLSKKMPGPELPEITLPGAVPVNAAGPPMVLPVA